MIDYIQYIAAGSVLIFATETGADMGIPNIIQQSIAIAVLLLVLGYQMTKQEKLNKNIVDSIDKQSDNLQALIASIATLIKQSEQTAQDNRETVKLLLEHIEKDAEK